MGFSLAEFKTKIDNILKVDQTGKKVSKRKNLFKNCTFILNQRTSFVPYHEAIKEEELKRFDAQKEGKQDFFFCREDQIEDIKEMLYPGKDYDAVLQKINGYISDEEYGALKFAARICKKEDDGKDASDLRKQLGAAFGQIGHTMYNWLRCGDVFSNDVFPFMEFIKKRFPKDVKPAIRLYWESLKKYHHARVFVRSWMKEDQLSEEILKRALIDEIDTIHIYSRASRIPFARKTIMGLLNESLTAYRFKAKKPVKLGKSLAQTFVLSKK